MTMLHSAAPQEKDREAGARGSVYEIVVIAASAGGIPALSVLLGSLPATFPAPIAVVLHRSAYRPDLLARVLGRHTLLRVKEAEESERPLSGTVYLAPPDRHLWLRWDGVFTLLDGTRICFVLSSANPLFVSAADTLQGRVIAVALTGGGSDAADGVQAVKQQGGVVIAQDQATSLCFGMPRAAIESGAVDYVLPLSEIASALCRLVRGKAAHEEIIR